MEGDRQIDNQINICRVVINAEKKYKIRKGQEMCVGVKFSNLILKKNLYLEKNYKNSTYGLAKGTGVETKKSGIWNIVGSPDV